MRKRYRPHHHRLLKVTLAVLLIFVIIGFYKYQQYNHLISTPAKPGSAEEMIFTIKKGESLKNIASALQQDGLILDQESFNWYGRLEGLDKEVKSGRFPLGPGMTAKEIYQTLTSNAQRQEVVTIPEGSTVPDIDRILSELSLITPGELNQAANSFDSYDKYAFLNREKQSSLTHPLEGYLFPDTYYVSALNFSPEEFLSMLLNTFQQKALPVLQTSSRPLAETVIVASMIEKEANRDPDRPIIAGIIWKRLAEDWVLGIDATLLYLKNDRTITYQDLQEDSPYNTRKNPGLPPGPICNPGLASLQAAAQPENSPYYFYLTNRSGDMVYAVSNEEHNRNKSQL